jgi:trk system potassium uptake protein TrkA
VRELTLPHDSALVAILRGGRVLVPTGDDPVEAGDELMFLCTAEVEDEIQEVFSGAR